MTYVYDAAGRLVGLTDPNTGDVDYTLDDDGRVLSTALPDGETRQFDYNNDEWTGPRDITYGRSVRGLAGSANDHWGSRMFRAPRPVRRQGVGGGGAPEGAW